MNCVFLKLFKSVQTFHFSLKTLFRLDVHFKSIVERTNVSFRSVFNENNFFLKRFKKNQLPIISP